MAEKEELIHLAKASLEKLVSAGGSLDFHSFCSVGMELAAAVNGLKDLKGTEKKEVVLYSLRGAAERVLAEASEKGAPIAGVSLEMIDDWVKSTLPTVLEFAVAAARGKYSLGRPAELVAAVVADPGKIAPVVSAVTSCCLPRLALCLPLFASALPKPEEKSKDVPAPLPAAELPAADPAAEEKKSEAPPQEQESPPKQEESPQ